MINYLIYKPNGQAIKSGYCHKDNVPKPVGDEKIFLSDEYFNWADHYVVNGSPVKLPPKPSNTHYFDYQNKQWVDNAEEKKKEVVSKRNQLLFMSDWTHSTDSPLTAEKKQAWAVYRQQLRDITQQPGYPHNVVWPQQPE